MNEVLKGRLLNWKFDSATAYLQDASDEVKELVNALSAAYGNSGWFGGQQGLIVYHALKSIGVVEEDN